MGVDLLFFVLVRSNAPEAYRSFFDQATVLAVGFGLSLGRDELEAYAVVEGFKERMREYLRKVEDGEIAKEWMLKDSLGRPVLNRLMKRFLAHPALAVERAMLARRKEAPV